MKLYRNAIILAVVLALAVGAYFVVKNVKEKNNTNQQIKNTAIELVKIDDDDVDTVTLINKNGTKIVIGKVVKNDTKSSADTSNNTNATESTESTNATTSTNATENTADTKEETWGVIYPENFNSDEAKCKAIVWNLNPLSANKVIEEEASDLSKYGLDNPFQVIVKTKDGSETTIEFGKKTATGENYYVKMKDSNKVYTISTSYAEKFIVELNDLKSTDIFEETADQVKKVTLWKNGKIVFSATAGEMSEEMKQAYSQIQSVSAVWNVTAPIETEADTDKITRIINTLLSISAREYITDKADDLSKYGLDNPSYAIEISTDTTTKKLLLGKERPEEETKDSISYSSSKAQTYAKFEGSDEIFTVGSDTLTFIDTPIKDVVSDINLIVFIDNISHFSFTMNGNTDEFDIIHDNDDNKDNDKFTMNGKDASMKDSDGTQIFRKFYQSVVGIRTEEVDLEGNPQGDPEVTFVYTYKSDGSTMKIDFVSRDNYYYYVLKNGKYTGLIVKKTYFDKNSDLVKNYNALKEAVEKQSNQ